MVQAFRTRSPLDCRAYIKKVGAWKGWRQWVSGGEGMMLTRKSHLFPPDAYTSLSFTPPCCSIRLQEGLEEGLYNLVLFVSYTGIKTFTLSM